MRRNKPTVHLRQELSRAFDSFRGADWSSHPDTVPADMCPDLCNLDPRGGFAETRPGSRLYKAGYGLHGFISDMVSYACYDTATGEFIIAQCSTGDFYYLDVSGGQQIPALLMNKTDGSLALHLVNPSCMLQSAGVMYVFSKSGNAVIEISGGVPVWRWMGINSAVSTVTPTTSGSVGLPPGSYCYAVAAVAKSGDLVIASSGARRSTVYYGGYVMTFAGTTPTQIEVSVSTFGYESTGGRSLFADTRESWTHIRLYRSKNLEGNVGAQNELYLLQEIPRATWIAGTWKFAPDTVPDESIDDSTVILADEIDLRPMPAGYVGSVARRRVWVGGCFALDPTESRLYYGGIPDSPYSEVYVPIQAQIPCSVGDGQRIIDIQSMDDDLVVLKTSSTYRVPGGDPANGAILVDPNIGVAKPGAAFPVSGLGMCAVCSDGVFRLLERSFVWTTTIGGRDVARPVAKIFDAGSSLRGVWHRNKLYVLRTAPASTDVFVLLLDGDPAWTRYAFSLGSVPVDALVQINDRRTLLLFPLEKAPLEIDLESLHDDYDFLTSSSSPIQASMRVAPVQASGLVEMWALDLLAALALPASVIDVFSSGDAWFGDGVVTELAFLPSPVPVRWVGTMRPYQWFPQPTAVAQSRPLGSSLSFAIQFSGAAVIRRIDMHGYLESGPMPVGWDPWLESRGEAE